MRKIAAPYEPPEEPPKPQARQEVPGIDLSWCDGVKERWWKRLFIKLLKQNIQWSYYMIKRLDAPVKAADMPEIEEEEGP